MTVFLQKYHAALSWAGLTVGLLLLLGVGIFSDLWHQVFLFLAVVVIFGSFLIAKIYGAKSL